MKQQTNVNTVYTETLDRNRRLTITAVNTANSKPKEATDDYQTALLKKTWIALIKDLFFGPQATELSFFIRRTTISEAIDLSLLVSDYILYGGERPASPFMRLYDLDTINNMDHRRKVLEVCRFPKRYTPNSLPGTKKQFWETNERVAAYDPARHEFILDYVRNHCYLLLGNIRYNDWEWSLSTGSDFESDSSLVDKIYSAERYLPNMMGISLGTPYWNVPNGALQMRNENRIKSVPKTYNKVRYIAMEPQWMSVLAQPVARAIERCLPDYADIHDQFHNQELARKASYDNTLCTVDLSAASDSLSKRLIEYVLPTDLYNRILAVTSRREAPQRDAWGDPKQRYDAAFGWVDRTPDYSMISTMGNRVTFPLETLVFSAILETVADLVGDVTNIQTCGVYGDDIICPTSWYPTLIDVLSACGFIVNTEKSFADDSYFRESCGAEFFKGSPMRSNYWPRKALNKENALPSLVALQHSFYLSPYVNEVLTTEIRKLCPKITESLPQSPYDDIWSLYPDIKRAYGSYELRMEEEPSCEVHTMLVAQKGDSSWSEASDRYRYYQFLRDGHRPHEDPVLAAVGYPAEKDVTRGSVHPVVVPKNRKFLI